MSVTAKKVEPKETLPLAQSAPAAGAAGAVAPEVKYVILELAIYRRYTRGTGNAAKTYENDKAYRFKEDQAAILLQEVEESSGRPIWRRYAPKKIAHQLKVPEGHKLTVAADHDAVKKLDTNEAVAAQKQAVSIVVGDDAEVVELLGGLPEIDSGEVVEV